MKLLKPPKQQSKAKAVGMKVNFNGKLVWTTGVVLNRQDNNYLVDFQHKGVEFRGWWPVSSCREL